MWATLLNMLTKKCRQHFQKNVEEKYSQHFRKMLIEKILTTVQKIINKENKKVKAGDMN
jgi:hypothetical protein